MTREEVSGCLALMGTLWNSYKPPQNAADVSAIVNTWLRFFSSVPVDEVTHAIFTLSADGREFAPQVGEIYKAVKDARGTAVLASPDVQKLDRWYREHCEAFAAVGVPTAVEALRRGISHADWCKMANAAGL